MKKVLVIAPYAYLPYFSGGQKFIAQFLYHLGKETDLTVITVAENDFSLAGTYITIPLLKKSFARYYDFSLVKKITRLVKQGGFDTIIWEHPYYAWLAFRIRKRTGVRTIIHTHNIEYKRFKSTGRWWWPLLKWYERGCFRKADGIFFITPEDKNFAIADWKIPESKCFDLPFGLEISQYPDDRSRCKEEICRRHGIPAGSAILYFNGLLNYKPNLDALKTILEKINPLLLTKEEFRYKIIISGKGLPDDMKQLKAYADKNIIYAGFVEDIEAYYKAADILLNPVQSGGGIKTKMVEAIACGTAVISTQSGAAGMDKTVSGNKLAVVNDSDWKGFTEKIGETVSEGEQITPQAFYQKYNWQSITRKIVATAI
ncbi:MAG: glycosyltransferase family 4 protein [Bacteroidota bacterium]